MSLKDNRHLRVVLYEGAGAEPFSAGDRFATLSALLEKGFSVTRAGDGDRVAAPDDSAMVVVGRFDPDALSGLSWAAAGPDSEPIRVFDARSKSPDEIVAEVETAREGVGTRRPGEWKPWFPVIDYDRCTNCMQCLSFCLFDVYGVDDQQRIQVQNNDNCKTNCPACSRVCPEAAIMFPKYRSGPINGAPVSQADLNREKMKVDISSLLGGDIYQLLRTRSERAKSRFSKERDSDKALKERQKCLVKLQQAGDIPAEVLMSLPSPEEIQERAANAKRKADLALGHREPAGNAEPSRTG